MSYIISAGNKKPQWIPEGKKKVAQVDAAIIETPKEEENPFYDAIKNLDGIKEQTAGLEQAIETATEAVEAVKEVAIAEGVIEPKAVEVAPAAEVAIEAPKTEEKVEEKVEEKAEAKKEEPKAEDKKEEIVVKDGKEEVKEVAKEEKTPEVDEVEIEIPGVIEEEGKVEKEGCGFTTASSNGKLIALSKLSPENRKEIAKFWRDDLGMPADYVAAMVKDY